jgi:LytS/YehU family sensor histidine kinase
VTLSALRQNRNLLFWSLHLFGWSAFLIAQYFGALLYEVPPGHIKAVLVMAASGFVLTAQLRYVYRRLWGRPAHVVIPAVLLICWLTALVWRVIVNSATSYFVEDWLSKEPWYAIFMYALSSTYLVLCWSGLYFGIRYYETLQREREEVLKASALAQEAQVKMLRYQLNPHFMFNTLNAISTLVLEGESRVASQAISRLSEFLRYTLDQDPMKRVTLRHEVEALNLYLGIEQLRFGDRLRLEYEIDEAAYPALVPSLILQPLVENSLKYAIAPREEGGRLRIMAQLEGPDLKMVVADDGPGLPVGVELGEGRGVGFRNTRERLAALYGAHHTLAVRFARPGLRLEITIPFERAVQP